MSKRSRPRPSESNVFATLLESRPGVPKPIDHDSIDVDDLPGVHTSPVRHSAVLAAVDANALRLRDPETRPARRDLARRARELAALLDSRTDQSARPTLERGRAEEMGAEEMGPVPQFDPVRAAKRARLERVARAAGERIQKRTRRR